MWKPLIGLVGLAAAAWSLQAHAAVTVIGSGMAHEGSQAALSGESDQRFEEVCTLALDSELLLPRDRAGTYVNRGVLKLRRREYASAMFDFNRAVQIKPDLGEAYVNRGDITVGEPFRKMAKMIGGEKYDQKLFSRPEQQTETRKSAS